jgi:hypothetical protein
VTTPPCGFVFDKTGTGDYIVDFGFKVDDRFYSATSAAFATTISACSDYAGGCNNQVTTNQVEVVTYAPLINQYWDAKFYLVVY